MAAGERSEVSFSIDPSRDVAVAISFVPIVWIVHMRFARAAPPAYDQGASVYTRGRPSTSLVDHANTPCRGKSISAFTIRRVGFACDWIIRQEVQVLR